jgi:hypothetical protein
MIHPQDDGLAGFVQQVLSIGTQTVLLGYSALPLSKAVHDDDKAPCQATVYLSSRNHKA